MKRDALYRYARQSIQTHVHTLTQYQQKIGQTFRSSLLHDIRVACRRLRTSLWIFKDILPEEKRITWKENLKRFARSLGRARDLDVQIAFLKKVNPPKNKGACVSGMRAYINDLCARRYALAGGIIASRNHFAAKGTLESIRAFLHSNSSHAAASLHKLKKDRIGKCLEELCAFEQFVYDPNKNKELHRMRIAAKHLRYTLEIFGSADPSLIVYGQHARSMQRALGTLHDFDVWIAQLRRRRALSKEVKQYLAELYRVRRAHAYKRVVTIWEQQSRKKVWEELQKQLDL